VFPLLVKCNNIVIILRFGNYALSYRPMIRMGCCLPLPQLDDTRLSGYQYQTLALVVVLGGSICNRSFTI
jgi:hypothetical protein